MAEFGITGTGIGYTGFNNRYVPVDGASESGRMPGQISDRQTDPEKVPGRVSGKKSDQEGSEECQTCKNRKYVDGSNESDVSFKSPGHVSPEASYGAVTAHERQHVSNAIAEGSKENKELVSVNVRIKMERCPECGKVYAAGGETTTVIKTSQPTYNDTPYDQARKLLDAENLAGAGIDAKA